MNSLETIVLGGSVNPPTKAHEAMLRACLALPGVNEVWLMPSGDRLDKHMAASDDDRLRMAEIVKRTQFADEPRLQVSDFELYLPRPTQTFRTAAALQEAFTDRTFRFAFGWDSYLDMPNWERGARLQKELRLLIFGRNGSPEVVANNVVYQEIGNTYQQVASERARQLVATGGAIADLVSEPVARYIAEHQLYGSRAMAADLRA